MRKLIALLSIGVLLVSTSCNNEPAVEKKEVIVVPAPPKVVVQDPPEKATTVTLDKNGVKVTTKKVDVNLKKQ